MAKKKPLGAASTTMATEGEELRGETKKKKSPKSGKARRVPLGPNRPQTKKVKQNNGSKQKIEKEAKSSDGKRHNVAMSQHSSPAEQRKFFLGHFESVNGIKLSSLELESIKDMYFLKLSEGISQDAGNLWRHVKDTFGSSWKEVLFEDQLIEGKIDPGNPSVLVISASAIRSLELLRGLRTLAKKCQVAKLFSKHIKIDDQVAFLKNRVNLASGTPSRIKKLCEMEALGLSRLEIIVLDMHTDVKGYSLLTLPQVRDEFWDLYKSYLHQRLVQGNLRICLYGPIPAASGLNMMNSGDQ